MQHKIRQTKRAARSELSVSRGEWQKHGYADTNLLDISSIQDNIPRVHASVSGITNGFRAAGCTSTNVKSFCHQTINRNCKLCRKCRAQDGPVTPYFKMQSSPYRLRTAQSLTIHILKAYTLRGLGRNRDDAIQQAGGY
jgi:hypothetical protein